LTYDFLDDERRLIEPFKWQLYNAASSIDEVKDWLHNGRFPSALNSKEVIQGIGRARIGTGNPQTINEFITPAGNISLIVTIDWRPGKGPGSSVRVLSRTKAKSEVKQYDGR
jgi:hypothetical protein